MNNNIDPKKYEYLWTDHDVNYIFTSCYLFDEFRNADIVLIYNHNEKALKFFLSKKQRKEFADVGLEFYYCDYSNWKTNVSACIRRGSKLIEVSKNDALNVSKMTLSELKAKISERVNLFQTLGRFYFYTEFFFLDKVEHLIKICPGLNSVKNKIIAENLADMGSMKIKARSVLTEFYNYAHVFAPYVDELIKRTGRHDMPWLSYDEIYDVIDGKDVPVSDRDKRDWVLAKSKGWKIANEEEAKKIISEFENHFFNLNLTSVKGTAANPGIYKGTVRIIKTLFSDNISDELKKVKNGEVLIANTTGPEMMSACQRAGAIVTDEGGITSHAAVVSRELKIPCIVGTKNATIVFKDKDVVEVDANKGLVRKIN
jgi:phosphohistidine swiveling domain-containing protein